NALASVKGTSFGLGEAASVAAGAVAAGIKPGKELERTLKVMGDTATIAGTSLSDMGLIFNSVAARGKLQGDDMLQLLSRGVPVLQLLGDQLGKTSAEISDMVSKGQIDFATFQAAMEKGMGGAALEAGQTVQGALANMGAAAGRLGATLAGPFYNQAAGAFTGVTSALDSLNDAVAPTMKQLDQWISGSAVPALKKFGQSAMQAWEEIANSQAARHALTDTIATMRGLGTVAAGIIPPIVEIAGALLKASASLGISTWDVFVTALEAAATILDATLVPALQALSSLASQHQGVVTAMVAAWMAFKTVPSMLTKAGDPLKNVSSYAASAGSALGQMRQQVQRFAAAHPELTRTQVALKAISTQSPLIGQMGTAFVTAGGGVRGFGAAMKVGAVPAMNALKAGASSLIGALGGPWMIAFAAAAAAVSASMAETRRMNAVLDEMKGASVRAGEAVRSMFEAIGSGSSRIDAAEQAVDSMMSSLKTMGDNAPGVWGRMDTALLEWHYNVKESIGTLRESEGALTRQKIAARDAADDAKAAGEAMRDLGLTNRDLAQAAAGSGAAYEDMRAKLMNAGRGGQVLARELETLRDQIQQAESAADRLGPAGMRMAQVLDDIASKAGTAEDRAAALRVAFMELAGVEMNAADASAELTRVIDNVAGQMDQFAGATMTANGVLDTTSTSGAAAHKALNDIGDAMVRSVAAGNDASQVYAQFEGQLGALKGQLGLTEEQYQRLLEAYGLTPEKLVTAAELQDGEALASLAQVREEVNALDGATGTVTAAVKDEEARKKLEELGFKIERYDEATGVADIRVDDAEAAAKLDDYINGKIPALDNLHADPKVGLDDTGFRVEADAVDQTLEALGVSEATPEVRLLTDKLREGKALTASELQELTAMSAKPTAELEKTLLDMGISQASIDLLGLSMKEAQPSAHLDATGLFATNDLAMARLATLNLARPFPWADLDISKLDARQLQALQKVGLLDGQRPTPQAGMNIDQLTAEQQAALAKVFDLDSQRPTPWASMTKTDLDAKAADALRRLKEVDAERPNPRVTAETRSAMNALGGVRSALASLKDKVINISVIRRFFGGGEYTGGRFAAGGRYDLAAYASGDRHDGYRLPTSGPGTHETDGFLALDQSGMPVARLDHGEWIINRRSSARYDRELAAINAGTFPKLPGYATGGKHDEHPVYGAGEEVTAPSADDYLRFARGESVNGVQASRPLDGAPYVWGGSNWGDCSGTASAFAAFGIGMNPFPRKFATASEESWLRANGFTMGRGPEGSLRIGWYNGGAGGGHTSVTLPDGTNAEMGGSSSSGKLGGNAAGADHPQYTHHAWIPAGSGSTSDSASDDQWDFTDDERATGGAHSSTGGARSSTSGGDDNMVPLSPDAADAADRLDDSDPGLLGGQSTWSDFAGSAVAAMVGGHVKDVLKVFGIPDELPPIVKAGQQWYQMVRDSRRDAAEQGEKSIIAAADGVDDAAEAETAAADDSDTPAAPVAPAADWGPEFFVHEITRKAKDLSLSADGAKIGVATALVESGDPMKMYANRAVPESLNYRHDALGSDHDSVGLFQQRDNGAWGTVADRMDPYRSAGLFYQAMLRKFPDWESRDPGAVAQGVQVSAFPDRYATKMDRAMQLVKETGLYDSGGILNHRGLALNLSGQPEAILTRKQWEMLQRLAGDDGPVKQFIDGRRSDDVAEPEAAPAMVEEPAAAPPTPDKGAAGKLFDEAIPQVLAQNTLSEMAGMATSMAVRAAGSAVTSAAQSAITGGAAGAPAAAAIPGVGALAAPVAAAGVGGQSAAGLVGWGGNAATDLAAWYSGEVASGVVGAFETFAKDMIGATPAAISDIIDVVRDPDAAFRSLTGLDTPWERMPLPSAPPAPVAASTSAGGDTYNFIANDRAGLFSDYRREQAKRSKGLVGAR
ncbi:MAG: tape measure protein, partial [Bowdeniella nasicola]|nr:tape measure protein [Bowdeniella nasicola]